MQTIDCSRLFLSFILVFFYSSKALAATAYPSELTLEFVLLKARSASQEYKKVDAQTLAIGTAELQSQAMSVPQLSLGYRKLLDRSQTLSPFSPTSTEAQSYFLQLSKGFTATGTQVVLDLNNTYTSVVIPGISIPSNFENKWSLGVKQSIWQGLVRGAFKDQASAGTQTTVTQKLAYQMELNQVSYGLIRLYYQAWLLQSEVKIANQNLENKKKLLEITQIKFKRGTADRPDLLQAQVGYKEAMNQKALASDALVDIWRRLVVELDLPKELSSKDPLTIPIQLDRKYLLSQKKCDSKSTPSLTEKLAESQFKTAQSLARGLGAQSSFDISLAGSYGANALDLDSRTKALSESLDRDTPSWSVELAAQIPLGAGASKAQALQAYADATKARSVYESEKSQTLLNLESNCKVLQTRMSNFKRSEENLQALKERLRYEESRFKVGKIPFYQLMMASNDVLYTERALKQDEIEKRMSAWDVLKLSGSLLEQVGGKSHE